MLQAFFLLVSISVLYLAALHGDLRQYVQALDATNQRYRMATASGSVGVWEWNPHSGDLILDPRLKNLLGYEDHQIANRVDAWVAHMHRDDGDRLIDQATAYASGKRAGSRGRAPNAACGRRHTVVSFAWQAGAPRARRTRPDPRRHHRRHRAAPDRGRAAQPGILWAAMMASLTEHVAIIDRFGGLIAVNDAWSRFAGEGTEGRFEGRPSVPTTSRSADGPAMMPRRLAPRRELRRSWTDRRPAFRMEYDCSSRTPCAGTSSPSSRFVGRKSGAVLSHRDIARKRAEVEATAAPGADASHARRHPRPAFGRPGPRAEPAVDGDLEQRPGGPALSGAGTAGTRRAAQRSRRHRGCRQASRRRDPPYARSTEERRRAVSSSRP